MSNRFNPQRGLIVVRVELTGPLGTAMIALALDTGATGTLIGQTRLLELGYDPALETERFQITTGSGIEFVPRLTVNRFTALGHTKNNFPVLCHNLPPNTRIDGLLGLDFFRGLNLNLDFRSGLITIS